MKPQFLKWWTIFVLITLGVGYIIYSGMIDKINCADITKISFLIFVIFIYYSIRIGLALYGIGVGIKQQATKAAGYLPTLGLIGTVLGFIWLCYSFEGLGQNPTPEAMKTAIGFMSKGMGMALYTTAAGLIGNLLLRLQLDLCDGKE